jgi:hypothetical protein
MKTTVLESALPRLELQISRASTNAELLAASTLRARSFYVYPKEREFAGAHHLTEGCSA